MKLCTIALSFAAAAELWNTTRRDAATSNKRAASRSPHSAVGLGVCILSLCQAQAGSRQAGKVRSNFAVLSICPRVHFTVRIGYCVTVKASQNGNNNKLS